MLISLCSKAFHSLGAADAQHGGLSELAEGARLEIACTRKRVSRVRISCPPPILKSRRSGFRNDGFFLKTSGEVVRIVFNRA